jgi:hypothetical protein
VDLRLKQGQWRIEAAADGWQLRIRRRLSPFEYAPSSLPLYSRWVFWVLLVALPLLTYALQGRAIRGLGAMVLPFLSAAWILALWFLPHKASLVLGASYVEAVRELAIPFHHGKFDVTAGEFDEPCLDSLRFDPLKQPPGRVAMLFDGHIEKSVLLIGWPGVEASTATDIRSALLRRIHDERRAGGL